VYEQLRIVPSQLSQEQRSSSFVEPEALQHAHEARRPRAHALNGEPRSLTKTKGDDWLSRRSRRRARSSSPWIGCVLGVPFLTRRTWSTEVDLVPPQVARLSRPQAVPGALDAAASCRQSWSDGWAEVMVAAPTTANPRFWLASLRRILRSGMTCQDTSLLQENFR
jgi:hypothetical protein